MKTGLVYCVRNKINNKCYIGQTWMSLQRRRYHHEQKALRCDQGKESISAFCLAIKKYGIDVFDWHILFDGIVDQDEMDELESDSIKVFNTMSPNGYNIRFGGSNGIN